MSATDVVVTAPAKEKPDGCHPSLCSLDVDVSSDGEALNNTAVTVINGKTKDQVFSGYTDSAGQINVTLPQGKYTVVTQGKSEQINLNKDSTVDSNSAMTSGLQDDHYIPLLILSLLSQPVSSERLVA